MYRSKLHQWLINQTCTRAKLQQMSSPFNFFKLSTCSFVILQGTLKQYSYISFSVVICRVDHSWKLTLVTIADSHVGKPCCPHCYIVIPSIYPCIDQIYYYYWNESFGMIVALKANARTKLNAAVSVLMMIS